MPRHMPDRKLVAYLRPQSPGAEAYRVLRTNLQFMAMDQPLRSILITSSIPEEGKSLTAANLAIAFAQASQNVLLIDADLRRPNVSKMFGTSGRFTGLTSVLAGSVPVEEAIRPGPIPGLSILPSGPIPPNPAELIGSSRMAALLMNLDGLFDLIILDTPPVLAVTDSCALAPRVDGVVIVVRANAVGHPQARRAKEALTAVKARILGVVLDAVQRQSGSRYDYYYYYGRS